MSAYESFTKPKPKPPSADRGTPLPAPKRFGEPAGKPIIGNGPLPKPPQQSPSTKGTKAEGFGEEVQEGDAFIEGDGDTHEVDPNDVNQNHIGDCWLMGGLAAIARVHPELIRNMIKPAGPGLWAVTFHFPKVPGGFETETVVVDASVPVNPTSHLPVFAGTGDRKNGKSELWPLLIEKAYAQTQGSYAGIEGGSSPPGHKAMEMVTGKVNGSLDVNTDPDTLLNQLDIAFRFARKAVTFGTIPHGHPNESLAKDQLKIRPNHTYALTAVIKETRCVYLINPWGTPYPTSLDIDNVSKVIDVITTNG